MYLYYNVYRFGGYAKMQLLRLLCLRVNLTIFTRIIF